jgi:hypothetical protein
LSHRLIVHAFPKTRQRKKGHDKVQSERILSDRRKRSQDSSQRLVGSKDVIVTFFERIGGNAAFGRVEVSQKASMYLAIAPGPIIEGKNTN